MTTEFIDYVRFIAMTMIYFLSAKRIGQLKAKQS